MSDLDPAAIMAEHQDHGDVGYDGMMACTRTRLPGDSHCLPYQLAAKVITLRAQVVAAWFEGYERGVGRPAFPPDNPYYRASVEPKP